MSKLKKNCTKCQHYHTTWDPQLPHGCRKFGFKSHGLPASLVKDATGDGCLAFELRANLKQKKKLDLNDDSLW